METWKCFLLQRRGRPVRNPVSDFVFPIPGRRMRSTTPVTYLLGRETVTLHATQYQCGTCLRP
ncbi:Hypothetical protein FKW44_016594 [Caligus rogercresseyi]|uniref:Uncharacterized protein n=1 Tax=Caligus rogercresseyi TaxID=217165 RepID=A0A7T8H248_CALRO|nr:Hypothetical protein FKW44_016594 [Caligus rogercresseyi]